MSYFYSSTAGAFLMLFALLFAFLCTAVITWIKIKKEKESY
jgi:Flp pilus assembly protein TadG